MTKAAPHAGEELPQARTRHRRWRISTVWVVPIVAALVAGYLVLQHVREFGGTITIHFLTASGVKPSETPVRYRGADIGKVVAVHLSRDQQHVEVEVKLRRSAASVAREGSVFWIVRPDVSLGEITGLGTIFSGPFIQVLPGHGKPATEFTGAETSPQVLDPHGFNVVLLARDGGSLRAGAPIYYRGIQVGVVHATQLSSNAATVEIDGVIRRRYAALVRTGSKFWNVTGLELHVGLFRGAELNVESLKSLLIGGIAFATPDDPKAKPAENGAAFRLYDEAAKEWSSWAPSIMIPPEEGEESPEKIQHEPRLPLSPSTRP